MTPQKGEGGGGGKIWDPSFSHCLDPIEPRSAKKSILAQKSYGNSYLDTRDRTIWVVNGHSLVLVVMYVEKLH